MSSDDVLTENEANNLIYLGLKYACGWDDVPNEVIADALDSLPVVTVEEVSVVVLTRALRFGRTEYTGLPECMSKMAELTAKFREMSEAMRNDLGRDGAFFSCASKRH